MTDHLKDPFFDYFQHLKSLPDHILRDIALNDCAGHDYRKQAVEVLMVRGSRIINHTGIRGLVIELEAELDGLVFEHPDPEDIKPDPAPGPLTASVTTKTMFSDEVTEGLPLIKEVAVVPTPETKTIPPEPKRTRKPKEPADAV